LALEDIFAAIRAEADSEIESIRVDAEREVAALLERARRQARDEEERLSRSRDAAGQLQADRIVNRARLDRDRSLRVETDELYQRARHSATVTLNALRPTPQYEGVLRTLFEEACRAVGDGTTLRVHPDDETLARRILATSDQPALVVTPDLRSGGGVELVGPNGWTVLNTFESRLERAERHLRQLFRDTVDEGSSR
jgi:vacuolar-type H+-ATPase subunit E/Vma4